MAPVAVVPPRLAGRSAPRARTARALPALRARFTAVRDWCDVNTRAFGHNLRRTQARSFRRGPLALPGPLASVSLSADLGGDDEPSPREEVGRATWMLLHTIAAQFPDKPTKRQQQDVKTLVRQVAIRSAGAAGEGGRREGEEIGLRDQGGGAAPSAPGLAGLRTRGATAGFLSAEARGRGGRAWSRWSGA